ncbi:MAG: sialidase family protein, partial [Devosia sp.]
MSNRTSFALATYSGLLLTVLGTPAAFGESVPLADVAHIHGVAFDVTQPGQLLLATHYGVYRTEGSGLAQTISEDANDYMGFTPSPDNPTLLLASGHPAQGGNMGFIVSTDGGVTWSQRSPGASDAVDFHALTVSRADSRVLFGLYGSIQVSRDDGATWQVSG